MRERPIMSVRIETSHTILRYINMVISVTRIRCGVENTYVSADTAYYDLVWRFRG